MPIGIGAGVNLGSATAFLYMDARGMQQGVRAADRALDQFRRNVSSTADAVAAAQRRMSDLATFRTAFDLTNSRRFIELQEQAAAAVKRASTAISAAYRIRQGAVERFMAVMKQEGPLNTRLKNELVTAQKAKTAAIAKTEKALLDFQDAQKTGLKTGAGLDKFEQDLKTAQKELKETTEEVERLEREVKQSNDKIAASSDELARDIKKANDLEQKSIRETRLAIQKQSAAIAQIADKLGPEYKKMAQAVDIAGRKVISAQKAMAASQVKYSKEATKAIEAEGKARERAIERMEAADRSRDRAATAALSAQRNYTNQVNGFNQKVAQGYEKRADAAVAAEKKIVRATEEEERALNRLNDTTLDQVSSSAQSALYGIVTAVTAATGEFVKYDEQLHNVGAVSHDLEFATGAAKDAINLLAVEMGKSPVELAEGLYEIVQAGFEASESMDILDAAAKAGAGALVTVEQAARPLIGVINAYGREAYTAAEASDILFAAVEEGVFSYEELTLQIGDNLSIAAALGITLEELAASYVVLTKNGNHLNEATTQVNAVMSSFMKPSKALSAAIKEQTGETAQLFIRNHDLGEVLAVVQTLFEQNAESASALFPNIRALRGIYGLTTQQVASFNTSLGEMNNASDGAGRAAGHLAIQSQSVAFRLRQAREQVRQAIIQFGESLAPTVLRSADAMAYLAKQFTNLPASVKATVGGVSLLGIAFLGVLAVVGRVAVGVREAFLAFKAMQTWMAAGSLGARALLFALNPVVLALAAVATGAYILWSRHRRQEEAVREVTLAYQDLFIAIRKAELAGEITQNEAAQWVYLTEVIKASYETRTAMADAFVKVQEAHILAVQRAQEALYAADREGNAEAIATATRNLDLAKSAQDAFNKSLEGTNISIDVQSKALAFLGEALAMPNRDLPKITAHVLALAGGFGNGSIRQDEFLAGMKLLIDEAPRFEIGFIDAADAIAQEEAAVKELTESFGRSVATVEDMLASMAALTAETLKQAGAYQDLTSPLSFVQQRIGATGKTALETMAILSAMGHLDLTGAQKQALNLAARMDELEQKVVKTNEAIADHQTKMGEWQSMATLVNETVGSQADEYAALGDMLKRGKIDQEEYNKIKAAAIFLNERAKIGIDEERVAIAKSLPDLALFVDQHDILTKRYEDLTPEQRGFISALKDTTNQAIIMTAIMLKLAHAMAPEAFPREIATRFIADVSQADPEVAALLDHMGLIPESVKSEIIAEVTPESFQSIEDIDTEIERLRELLGSVGGVDVISPEQQTQVNDINTRIGELTARRREINLTVNADESDLTKLDSGIADTEKEAKEASTEIEEAWSDIFSGAKKSGEGFTASLKEVVKASLEAVKATANIAEPFEFLVKNANLASASIHGVVLKANELGAITLSGPELGAVKLASALDRAKETIALVTAEIATHTEAISEAQGHLTLLEEILGSSTGNLAKYKWELAHSKITQDEFNEAVKSGEAHKAFANLNKLVKEGYLTQAEANRIRAAALRLQGLSNQAVLREQAEIAKSIPALSAFVEKHERLKGAYQNLSDDQRGFLAALKDEQVQTALNTYVMLTFLEAMGRVAPGIANSFISMASKVNPALGAVADKLGIITNDGKPHQFSMTTTGLDEANLKAGALILKANRIKERIEMGVTITGEDATKAELDHMIERANRLEGNAVDIIVQATTGKAVQDLQNLETVVLDVQDNGTVMIYANSQDAVDEFARLNGLTLNDKNVIVGAKETTKVGERIDDVIPPEDVTTTVTAKAEGATDKVIALTAAVTKLEEVLSEVTVNVKFTTEGAQNILTVSSHLVGLGALALKAGNEVVENLYTGITSKEGRAKAAIDLIKSTINTQLNNWPTAFKPKAEAAAAALLKPFQNLTTFTGTSGQAGGGNGGPAGNAGINIGLAIVGGVPGGVDSSRSRSILATAAAAILGPFRALTTSGGVQTGPGGAGLGGGAAGNAGAQIGQAVVNGVITSLQQGQGSIGRAVDSSVLVALRVDQNKALEAGKPIGRMFINGVTESLYYGKDAISNSINWQIISPMASPAHYEGVKMKGRIIGGAFDIGVAEGIRNNYASPGGPMGAAQWLGQQLFTTTMNAIKAKSPSKLAENVGLAWNQGIANAMRANFEIIRRQAYAIRDVIMDALKDGKVSAEELLTIQNSVQSARSSGLDASMSARDQRVATTTAIANQSRVVNFYGDNVFQPRDLRSAESVEDYFLNWSRR